METVACVFKFLVVKWIILINLSEGEHTLKEREHRHRRRSLSFIPGECANENLTLIGNKS